jgi:hypothetical protein
MTQNEKVIAYLKENERPFCDDCLSEVLGITPRQTINQIARRLASQNMIGRSQTKECCYRCKSDKLVNYYYVSKRL